MGSQQQQLRGHQCLMLSSALASSCSFIKESVVYLASRSAWDKA